MTTSSSGGRSYSGKTIDMRTKRNRFVSIFPVRSLYTHVINLPLVFCAISVEMGKSTSIGGALCVRMANESVHTARLELPCVVVGYRAEPTGLRDRQRSLTGSL